MKIPECITSSGMHHIWRLKLMCIPRDNLYNTIDIHRHHYTCHICPSFQPVPVHTISLCSRNNVHIFY